MEQKLENLKKTIEYLSIFEEIVKMVKEKRIKELRESCPHKEVTETRETKTSPKVRVMIFPTRKCICCGLTESAFSGFQKLKNSKVVGPPKN